MNFSLIQIILLVVLVISALSAIWLRDLLKAGIALGILSVALSIIFFRMDSPYAAVFELSICSGLITVLFTSVVSLTKGQDNTDSGELKEDADK